MSSPQFFVLPPPLFFYSAHHPPPPPHKPQNNPPTTPPPPQPPTPPPPPTIPRHRHGVGFFFHVFFLTNVAAFPDGAAFPPPCDLVLTPPFPPAKSPLKMAFPSPILFPGFGQLYAPPLLEEVPFFFRPCKLHLLVSYRFAASLSLFPAPIVAWIKLHGLFCSRAVSAARGNHIDVRFILHQGSFTPALLRPFRQRITPRL